MQNIYNTLFSIKPTIPFTITNYHFTQDFRSVLYFDSFPVDLTDVLLSLWISILITLLFNCNIRSVFTRIVSYRFPTISLCNDCKYGRPFGSLYTQDWIKSTTLFCLWRKPIFVSRRPTYIYYGISIFRISVVASWQ